jgi:hypothetical protein
VNQTWLGEKGKDEEKAEPEAKRQIGAVTKKGFFGNKAVTFAD